MGSNAIAKKIYKNGDKVSWTITVSNDGEPTCYNSSLTFDIPDGIGLYGPKLKNTSQIIVPKGVFNLVTKTWHIGDLQSYEEIEANFVFIVDDIDLVNTELQSFTVSALLESSCTETILADNTILLNMLIYEQEPEACETRVNLAIGNTVDAACYSIGGTRREVIIPES